MDAQSVKQLLTQDDIIVIMDSLGVEPSQINSQYIIFPSICHHPDDWDKHGHKLYYYMSSHAMYCFSCGFRGDIFNIIERINGVSFVEAIQYVCNICHIEQVAVKKNDNIDPWQKELKRFLPNYEQDVHMPTYDKDGLALFKHYYPQSWLDDGITKQAMDKFNIGWYERTQQITIPVYDIDGNLVGVHGRNTQQWLIDKGLKYVPVKTLNDDYRFPTSGVLYGLYQNQDAIRKNKAAIICEAPKSILQAESQISENNTVALFGTNIQSRRRDMLLTMGIEEVSIALDRQYQYIGDDEWNIYVQKVKKIADLFRPYCNVYVIYDTQNRLAYKDSPFDKGKDIFNQLYNERKLIQ